MMKKGRFLAALLALCLSFTLTAQPAAVAAEMRTENAVSESVEVSSLTPSDAGFWDEFHPEYADDGDYMRLYRSHQTHASDKVTTLANANANPYTGLVYDHGINAGKTITYGIDVSKWQDRIDWKKVKAAGISFVFIRCGNTGTGSGTLNKDPLLESHVNGAYAAGLKVGIYYFSQARTTTEAEKEAMFTLEQIEPLRSKISLPVYFDPEQGSGYRIMGITPAAGTKNAKKFCSVIEAANFKAGIYGNPNDLKEIMDYTQLTAYPLWLARYNTKTGFTGQYGIWQYTSGGKVNGITDSNGKLVDVDCNFCYDSSITAAPPLTVTPPTTLPEVEPPTEPETPVTPEVPVEPPVVTPVEKPEKVTGVAKAGCTTSSITVKWNAAKGAAKYRIYVCTTKSGTYEIADTIDASATSYKVTGLKNNYAYYFKVRAWNSTGWGSTSSAMSAITSKGDARTLYTTNKVNLRSGAGTDYTKVTSVPKNTMLNVSSERMGSDGLSWYKVTYTASGKSYTGYLCGSYVKVGLRAKTKAKIKLLSSAKTSASTKATIASGKKVILLSSTKGSDGKTWYKTWYKTGSKTYTGYLPSSKVTKY